MKNAMKIILGVSLFILIAILLGRVTPIPTIYSDFMSLYHALSGWQQGYSFYDFTTQQALMFETTHLPKPDFKIELYPYFPYPPWYLAGTFFLAWLPFAWAYRTWLIINLGMLALSALLITSTQTREKRIWAVAAYILYFPAVGLFAVGNYTLPVLLGTAIFLYAVKREDAPLSALGLALLTFKPHIGILLALFGYGWLWTQKATFAIRARWMTLAAGLFLAMLGWLIEPNWISGLFNAIYTWQTASYIQTCTYCSSPANIIMRLIRSEAGMLSSSFLSILLFVVAAGLVWIQRKKIFSSIQKTMAIAAALTAVVLPYMVNYDYVILLIPLTVAFFLYQDRPHRIFVAALYILPWIGIFIGRAGNIFITLTGVALFAFFLFVDKPKGIYSLNVKEKN